MSWELVSKTTTGYKKWRDSYGNLRYQEPSGKFTNSRAFNVSKSQTEENPATPDIPTGGEVTQENVFTRTEREDLEYYDEMVDYSISEPYESYTPPVDKAFVVGRGYPINDYPRDKRAKQLKDKTEEIDYEIYAWGVYTLIIDSEDGTIISAGYRFTKHQTNASILEGEFKTIIDDLRAQVTDYGEVVVTETILKGMSYKE